jgi:ABC-type sugar transport system permease subunit
MLFALPATVLLILFLLWPVLTAIDYSTTSATGFGDKNSVGLANYVTAAQDFRLYAAAGRNVIFAAAVVSVSIFVAFALAYLLFVRVRGWRPLQVLLMIPFIMPVVVTAILWQFLLEPEAGLVNTTLRAVGLQALAGGWLTDQASALPSVSLVQIWVTVPVATLLIFSAMVSLPADVLEAAECDGAGHFSRMVRIVMPMVRPTVILVAFILTLQLFRSFDLIYLLTRGGPVSSTTVATLYVYVQGFTNINYGYANAVGVIIGVVLIAVALLFRARGRLIPVGSDAIETER